MKNEPMKNEPMKNESMKKQERIVDIPVTDESSAFFVLTQFITLAQKRGAYSIEESAKIFECYKQFNKE